MRNPDIVSRTLLLETVYAQPAFNGGTMRNPDIVARTLLLDMLSPHLMVERS